jgi:death on curing protein
VTNFLHVDDVVLLHDMRAREAPVIDWGKLDSAVHRPENLEAYEPDATIHDMVAALCEGISKAHAFLDGNKRTAVLAVVTFYQLNGYTFEAPDTELLHLVVDLTTGGIDTAKAAEMFTLWAYERPDEALEPT